MEFRRDRWFASPWLIGVVLMIGAGTAWFAWQDQPIPGLLLALAASFVLLRGPALPESSVDNVPSRPQDEERARFRSLWLILGIGFSFAVAERAMQNPPGKVWWLLLAWAASALLVFLAFVPVSAICAWIRHVRESLRADRHEWLFVLVLMMVAFTIRFVALGDFPDMLDQDEGYFAAQAADLRTVDHWEFSPFRYGARLQPVLYSTLQAVSIKFLGRSIEAARLPSVVIGVLTIPGLYLAARRMFDRRVAVVAALFLVVFPQHIHFSRLALNQPMDATLAIWTFAFLARALDQRDKVEYGLAGLTLGVSQYGYSSARLIPLLVVAYIGLYLLRRRAVLSWLGLLLIVTVSLALVWPQINFLLQTGSAIAPRLTDIGIWQANPSPDYIAGHPGEQVADFWIKQGSRSFLGFVQGADVGIFYGKFDPYLGWLASVPFLLGLVYAVRHRKDPQWAIVLLWWLGVVIFGGIAVANPPQFQRFVIATPALAILVAVGLIFIGDVLSWLSTILTPDQPLSWRAAYWGTAVTLVLMLAVFNLTTYFLAYQAAHVYFPGMGTAFLNELADDVLPLMAGYKVWLLSNTMPGFDLANAGILRYLSPNTTRVEYSDSPDSLPTILVVDGGKQAVILLPDYRHTDEAIAILDRQPGLTRRFVFWNRQHDKPWALIYVFDLER